MLLLYAFSVLTVLNLDCGNAKIKRGVTRISLKESEQCFPPGQIICFLKPSGNLRSLQMEVTDPHIPPAIFPVNTWLTGSISLILDNSEVIIAANLTGYRFLLPRSFRTGEWYIKLLNGCVLVVHWCKPMVTLK